MAEVVYVQQSGKGNSTTVVAVQEPTKDANKSDDIKLFTSSDPFNDVWEAIAKQQETMTSLQVVEANTLVMDTKVTSNISAKFYGGTVYNADGSTTQVAAGDSLVGSAQAKLSADASNKKVSTATVSADNAAVTQQSNLAGLYTGQGQSLTDSESQAAQTAASDLASVTNVGSGYASTNKAVTSLLQSQQTS